MPSGSPDEQHDDNEDELPPRQASQTVILRDIASAPPFLDLKYGHCAGCRRAGSRCDGHDNYTQACIQCRRRQDDCEWQLARDVGSSKSKGKKRAKSRKREESAVTEHEEEEQQQQDDEDVDNEDVPPRKRARTRSRSAVPWMQQEDQYGKLPVPSAGWPSASTSTSTMTRDRPAVKEEQIKMEPVSNDEDGGTSSDSSDDSEDGEENLQTDALHEEEDVKKRHTSFKLKDPDPEQMLAELQSSAKGNHFLTTQSYTSLLTSMHLEEASDLSSSLYWWDFSPSARAIRAKYPSLLEIKHGEWRNMSYLHQLLAENVYNWSLWPRPPSCSSSSSDTPSTSTLPSEISAIILSQISTSNLHKQVLSSLNDTQLKLLRNNHRNDRIPFQFRESKGYHKSVFKKSTYAIPTISDEELLEKYFNKEDIVLDHVEAIQESIGVIVQNAIERVLLKAAEMRLPKGARRPLSAQQDSKKVDKGKGRAVEDGDEQEEEQEVKKPSRRNKKAQAPGDWKSMLLAAISVPGLPRDAIEATVQRLEGLYGKTDIDFMKRYDAIHGIPTSLLKERGTLKDAPTDYVALGQRQNHDILARPVPPPRILPSQLKRPKAKSAVVEDNEGQEDPQDSRMDINEENVV